MACHTRVNLDAKTRNNITITFSSSVLGSSVIFDESAS